MVRRDKRYLAGLFLVYENDNDSADLNLSLDKDGDSELSKELHKSWQLRI